LHKNKTINLFIPFFLHIKENLEIFRTGLIVGNNKLIEFLEFLLQKPSKTKNLSNNTDTVKPLNLGHVGMMEWSVEFRVKSISKK
jgi:hypothetical protein